MAFTITNGTVKRKYNTGFLHLVKEIVINSQSRVLAIKTSYLSVLKELEDDSKFLENLIENAELELQ